MKIIFFISATVLLASACTGNGVPSSNNKGPVQNEAIGTDPNPGQQGNSFSISTEAHYQASIHSAFSPGKVIKLVLLPKGNVEMTTDNLDNHAIERDTGEWSTLKNGNLMLNLRRVGRQDTMNLEFHPDGEKLIYTGDKYGTAGLQLWVKHVPITDK
ncbi:MAG: hypothetical protein WCR52_09090 [Bacteroidota bacterium]|uniref:hypothetical protein n=1 Tax=Runella sp. TaxID=1960881 RepID=UPI003018FEF9